MLVTGEHLQHGIKLSERIASEESKLFRMNQYESVDRFKSRYLISERLERNRELWSSSMT